MVSYDTVRQIALALPDVEESTSYGTPALKVKGRLFIRLRDDIDSVVLKTSFDRRDALMAEDPATYYITDHYERYTWLLVRLSTVRRAAMKELVEDAYREALPLRRRRLARE